jgi:DNA-binding IclR family transcriptional regulator
MTGNAPALEKGLKVLEFLIAANEPLGLSRIAEGVGFKVSEIQRMVEYLAKEGYIIRTSASAYRPGIRAFALADLQKESALMSRAEGPLRRFTLKTTESIHLGFLAERMLHVVYDAPGQGTVRVSIKPGLYEAEDTVSGRLLLAFRGEDGEDSEAIRNKGYAFGEMTCAKGIFVVSVPLPLGANPCAAAIASPYTLKPGQEERHFREDLLEALGETAAEIDSLF